MSVPPAEDAAGARLGHRQHGAGRQVHRDVRHVHGRDEQHPRGLIARGFAHAMRAVGPADERGDRARLEPPIAFGRRTIGRPESTISSSSFP